MCSILIPQREKKQMEEQCMSPLNWAYYYQEEGIDELKHSLLYSTLELEAAILCAHEEISRKDDEILQLKSFLAKIISERDEFQANCQTLVLEKQLLSQQVQIKTQQPSKYLTSSVTTTNHEDDNFALSPLSNCDDNMMFLTSSPAGKDLFPLSPLSSPLSLPSLQPSPPLSPPLQSLTENGKFLKAVMEAGPLLQTLLLAGPLPQWQCPPPQLNSIDIPPVTISSHTTRNPSQESCLVSPRSPGGLSNKRAMLNREELSDFSPNSKNQKSCSPVMVDTNM